MLLMWRHSHNRVITVVPDGLVPTWCRDQSCNRRRFALIPVWIVNHMPRNVWDEITYAFPNFNGCTVEVWGWISNIIPHFIMGVITYPCLWKRSQGMSHRDIDFVHPLHRLLVAHCKFDQHNILHLFFLYGTPCNYDAEVLISGKVISSYFAAWWNMQLWLV